jgi:hypothetical protein
LGPISYRFRRFNAVFRPLGKAEIMREREAPAEPKANGALCPARSF